MKNKKRYSILLRTFGFLMITLVCRFFYLQVLCNDSLSRHACVQRAASVSIQGTRGDILDRNSIHITSQSEKTVIVLKPLFLKRKKEDIEEIARILNLDSAKLTKEIEFKKGPVLIEIENQDKPKILQTNIEGLSVVNYLNRFDKHTVAKHVIGYLNKTDQTGSCGIEKFYESFLNTNKESTVAAILDARDNVVQGYGYRLFSDKINKLNVKTTLNIHIQKVVEKVLEQNNMAGAVVVEDVSNGDIIAMASYPFFDQNSINSYLNSSNNELFNRAVASYNLGSIFKIIDVAEALEGKDFNDKDFYCKGSIKVGNKVFKCSSHKKGGHGHVNLKDAFALSCNSYFIDLGIRLGYDGIVNMAKKFGIGEVTGIEQQGIQESAGNATIKKNFFTDGDVANLSIGQSDIMATPLQTADIVAIIANNGIKNKINIVDCIVDDNGNKIKGIKQNENKRIISDQTCGTIQYLMKEVTSFGTGTKANLDRYGGAAGKTGSAETGQYIGGEKVVHAWFAGYFPLEKPKYAMSVFVENGKAGGEIAAPIFALIAEEIMKKGY